MTPALLLGIGIAVIAALETALWMMFRHRVEGIHFPHGVDASQLRFFTMRHIGLCAIAHTIFLLGSLGLFAALVW